MSNQSEIGKLINVHNYSSHSEDEEESLSLCDLPLVSTASDRQGEDGEKQREVGGDQSGSKLAKTSTKSKKEVGEDFDFGSLVASLDALESEMCAADEVFFRGQILPFRHSISSPSTAATASNLTRRSESMDRNVGSGFQSSSTASSSRSSSTRSSSINSTNSNDKRPLKFRNQFHSFPSPKPYARAANGPRSSISNTKSTSKRSSALWEIFRLGLVRTPEIELEDLKIRCSKQQNHGGGRSDAAVISRNSSSGGSSSGENGKSANNRSSTGELKSVRRKQRKSRGAMSIMSCKCTAEADEPEKLGKGMEVVKKRESEKEEETETEERRRKQDVSRHHRTFEWLKELSHAVVINDVSTST